MDYAANQGVDWVVLTNGVCWRVYKVTFSKPLDHELVIEIDFLALDPKKQADLEPLYMWCKEGWIKSILGEYHTQKQALSRFFLGAMVLSEPVLEVIRRELRRVSPDVRIEIDQIRQALSSEVLKRDVMEGEKAEEAAKKIARAANKALRVRTGKQPEEAATSPVPVQSAEPVQPPKQPDSSSDKPAA